MEETENVKWCVFKVPQYSKSYACSFFKTRSKLENVALQMFGGTFSCLMEILQRNYWKINNGHFLIQSILINSKTLSGGLGNWGKRVFISGKQRQSFKETREQRKYWEQGT